MTLLESERTTNRDEVVGVLSKSTIDTQYERRMRGIAALREDCHFYASNNNKAKKVIWRDEFTVFERSK